MAAGAPDLIVYPESERDVCVTLRAAAERDIVLIPFGGGSNIAGCLERGDARRMCVSLDMRRMRRVLAVDRRSFTAQIEAGVFGPDLEDQLGAHGMTLGDFPLFCTPLSAVGLPRARRECKVTSMARSKIW